MPKPATSSSSARCSGSSGPRRQVAQDYPETAFLMGSSFEPQDPNFSVFDNYIQECSYLTGLVAGAKTGSGVIGMIGGYPIPRSTG
ncbi:MAG: BMP family ABC transporter substrate-binding protein [Geminicoccaceae bacterium]